MPSRKILVLVQTAESDLNLDKDILNLNHLFVCPPPKNYSSFGIKKAF